MRNNFKTLLVVMVAFLLINVVLLTAAVVMALPIPGHFCDAEIWHYTQMQGHVALENWDLFLENDKIGSDGERVLVCKYNNYRIRSLRDGEATPGWSTHQPVMPTVPLP